MKGSVWILALLLAALPAHGYVLLTANIEDLQAIARRMLNSPMADQVHNILRRASSVFTQHVNRADDDEGSYSRRSDSKPSDDAISVADDHQLQAKNASVFLKSIKKIFENV